MPRGMTLIELTIMGVLTSILIFGAIYSFDAIVRSSGKLSSLTTRDSSLLTATKFIERLGKVATNCRKYQVDNKDTLECDVDFNVPATGSMTTVRFIQGTDNGKNVLRYEKKDSGGAWTLVLTYPQISSFRVCTGKEMSNGTCTIEPNKLNVIGANSDRVFRYELIGEGVGEAFQRTLRGAFFVRNPTPFGPDIVYQWSG